MRTLLVFNQQDISIKVPYFIFGFIRAMLIKRIVPLAKPLGPILVQLAKIGLTLFFIGAGLSAKVVRAVGIRPYLLGVLLWVAVSSMSLYVILRSA